MADRSKGGSPGTPTARARDVLGWLEHEGSARVRDGMTRYGIPNDTAYGVAVGVLQREAKRLGRDHALASALWKTGRYEARLMTAFLGEPGKLTVAQMDRWCADFDSWAVCDTVCLHLFDRSPLAWGRVRPWALKDDEFAKRGGFALLASLALHDKQAPDARFEPGLRLIEREATDDRNFVKKAVNWALRAIGRRSRALNEDAMLVAQRLAASSDASARWVGKDALRKLVVEKTRLAARQSKGRGRVAG
jgi:3-methyladenine DNA glycosylase AlkD